MRERAAEAETRLVVAVENFYSEPGFRLYQLEKLLPIARVAHSARGDHLCPVNAKLVGERRHSAEGSERVLNRDLAERSPFVEAGTQSRCRLHVVHHPDRARR